MQPRCAADLPSATAAVNIQATKIQATQDSGQPGAAPLIEHLPRASLAGQKAFQLRTVAKPVSCAPWPIYATPALRTLMAWKSDQYRRNSHVDRFERPWLAGFLDALLTLKSHDIFVTDGIVTGRSVLAAAHRARTASTGGPGAPSASTPASTMLPIGSSATAASRAGPTVGCYITTAGAAALRAGRQQALSGRPP